MNKVPFKIKLAFAVGDIFGGGAFNIINFLYPGFLALVVGLPAELAGLVMLIARIWDAVIDPVLGLLSDATSSRLGKRRIYILVAAPLVVLAMFLIFYPYSFTSIGARFAAVLLSYMFFCTVQSMVMIPYYSLSSELASDYMERSRSNALRLGFSIFSSILCVVIPGMIVDAFKTASDPLGKNGYIAMSLAFGLLFGGALLITALFAKEEIKTPPRRTRFSFTEFIRPLKLRPYRNYLFMQMCLSFSMSIMSSLFFLYVNFYFMRDTYAAHGSAGMVGLLGAGIMFAMQIVALPVYLKLIEKTSKTTVYRIGSAIWILSGLMVLLLKPGSSPIYLYILAVLMGFGISGPGLVPHTMFGDVNDAGEVLFGQRSEGNFGGLSNFINTIAQAIAISSVFGILGLVGFVEQQVGPGAPLVLSQPATAQYMLLFFLALAPLIFMGIGTLVSRRYTIDAACQRELLELIHDMKSSPDSAEVAARREAMIARLNAKKVPSKGAKIAG